MIINIRGYLTYRDVIGRQGIEQPDDIPITLLDLIQSLASELPGVEAQALFDNQTGRIGKSVAVMLNGVHYNHLPDRHQTELKDQDEIAIFPPAAGG